MALQPAIKCGISHPFSGKYKKRDGNGFTVLCADIRSWVYPSHSRHLLWEQKVLHQRIFSNSSISMSPCLKRYSSLHIINVTVTRPAYQWCCIRCVAWSRWKKSDRLHPHCIIIREKRFTRHNCHMIGHCVTFCATISSVPKSRHESRAFWRGSFRHNCNLLQFRLDTVKKLHIKVTTVLQSCEDKERESGGPRDKRTIFSHRKYTTAWSCPRKWCAHCVLATTLHTQDAASGCFVHAALQTILYSGNIALVKNESNLSCNSISDCWFARKSLLEGRNCRCCSEWFQKNLLVLL
jgi:hypothetical protein